MKGYLKPKYIQSVNDETVLWFEPSNQYAIVANGLYFCIHTYLEAATKADCIQSFKAITKGNQEEAIALFNGVEQFLIDRQTPVEVEINTPLLKQVDLEFSKSYTSNGLHFKVRFQSEDLSAYTHPIIGHLETDENANPDVNFDIYKEADTLYLYKNNVCIKSCPAKHFHQLQGKFNMALINSLYNKTEHDWVGLFHASTLSNNNTSVMLIGTSGSGKSTLTTLLSHNGYQLIADDTTPLLQADLNTYYFPGGISTKQGAFDTLKPYVPNLDKLENSYLRAYKGPIKYIPTKAPEKTHVPCNTMVLVNYQEGAATQLETITAKDALEILIPDSWISPKPENAKAFLQWISTLNYYKLTYSNNEEAIATFSAIFKSR